MTTNHIDLGKKIARTIHRGIETADRFWCVIAEEILEHLRKRLDVSEVVDVVKVTGSTHNAKDVDAMVMVYTVNSPGEKTVNLPNDPTEGRLIVVKDAGGYASVESIKVDAGSDTIDGDTTRTIEQDYGASSYAFHEGEWRELTTNAQASFPEILHILEVPAYFAEIPDEDTMATVPTTTLIGQSWTVDLPANPTQGRFVIVKDVGGNADTQNITISGNGGTIDGSASQLIDQVYGSFAYVYDGSAWRQVTEGSGVSGSSPGSGGVPLVDEFSAATDTDDTHTLSQAPVVGSVRVHINGIKQVEGDDFTVSGSDFTVLAAFKSGDEFSAVYYPA